jgi:hypothetical protein
MDTNVFDTKEIAMKNVMKTLISSFLGLFVFAIVGSATAQSFNFVDLDADPRWDVAYEGRTYDSATDTTTFGYTVFVFGDPALSHFNIEIPVCDELVLVGYYPGDAVSIGRDPTTGVTGIKWDLGQEPGEIRFHSVTFAGNIPEGDGLVAIKAGLFAIYGTRPGPSCDGVVDEELYSLSGTVFVDVNLNGVADATEPPIPNVTVGLFDLEGNLLATTVTDADGNYVFADLVAGEYVVEVLPVTESADFNEILFRFFYPTTPVIIGVTLDQDISGIDFGFAVRAGDILDELGPDAGEGRTIGFWKHQLTVAITKKGKAQIPATIVAGYMAEIDSFYLLDPFFFGGSFKLALDVIEKRTSAPVDLLKKQLLAGEFNLFAGFGLVEEYAGLQTLLLQWGESLVANYGDYSASTLLEAKDVFDGLNNLGH